MVEEDDYIKSVLEETENKEDEEDEEYEEEEEEEEGIEKNHRQEYVSMHEE